MTVQSPQIRPLSAAVIGVPPLTPAARRWAVLAVVCLGFGGLMALSLALGRTPGIQDLLPLGYFRMALVVHVVFTVVLWYLAMLGALSAWLGGGTGGRRVPVVAALACPLLAVPVLAGWGEPVLANYVPVGDHPVFFVGLALFTAAVVVPVIGLLRRLGRGASAVVWGVGAAGVTFLVALVCVALEAAALPAGLAPGPRFEALFWGGGHVLQFTNTILMVVAWQVLGSHLHGRPPLPPALFLAVTWGLAGISLVGPGLYLVTAPGEALRVLGFTEMFRFGLAGPAAVAVLGLAWALTRRGMVLAQPIGAGLSLSLLLFAVGGVLGYFMGAGDTRITGHYHAVIGGVTLAFMVLLTEVVAPPVSRRSSLVYVWAYGLGQLLHAVGLWLAGTGGVARKTAGADQGLSTPLEVAAMAGMGVGAVLAVVGGVTFVVVALRRLAAAPGGGGGERRSGAAC